MKRSLLLVSFVLTLLGFLFLFLKPTHPSTGQPQKATTSLKEAETPLEIEVAAPSVAREVVAPPATYSFSSKQGMISGVVVDENEIPIENARCTLFRGESPSGFAASAPVPLDFQAKLDQAKTDDRGSFRFPVEDGWWAIHVEADGMSAWQAKSLVAGDFRWIRLAPARYLSLHVQDQEGNPISSAEVYFKNEIYGHPHSFHAAALRTNFAGDLTLVRVPQNASVIEVAHENFIKETRELDHGMEAQIDLKLTLTKGIHIAGRVTVSAMERPPMSGMVQFETFEGTLVSHQVSCDAEGYYQSRLAFNPEFPLEISAQADGYGASRKSLVPMAEPQMEDGSIQVDFQLTSAERGAFGKVLSPDGEPLAGVKVYQKALLSLRKNRSFQVPPKDILERDGPPDLSSFNPVESMLAAFHLVTVTDERGVLAIHNLHAQKAYQLLLVSEEYSNRVLWIMNGEPGSEEDLGTIKLVAGGRVWGYVKDEHGNPRANVPVRTVGYQIINFQEEAGSVYEVPLPTSKLSAQKTITDQSGRFEFQPMAEGSFYLDGEFGMQGPYTLHPGEELGPLELTWDFGAGKSAENKIPFQLTVLDPIGNPVANALVQLIQVVPEREQTTLFGPSTWTSGNTVADGSIRLATYSEGTYDIVVMDFRGQLLSSTTRIDLNKNGYEGTVNLLADSNPSRDLQGTVRTPTGQPVANLKLTLQPVTGNLSCDCVRLEQTTDEFGFFTFGPFLKGNHRLFITDPEERFPPTTFYPARPGMPLDAVVGE